MADNATPPPAGPTIDLRQVQTGGTATGGTTPAATTAAAANASGAAQSPFGKFDIPETVKQQYPDLIPLILETESMNDDERQYWFQILPIMTEEQVGKLREILVNEKQQLKQLDTEYEQEMKKINEKHAVEWKAFEAKEKREKLQAAEGQAEKAEKATEEELLQKLQQM
ncbi:hypothetical protein HZA42_05525 [Candidatus Peregrinibacteria bacterium]|nr:hypothetical protein [Candidatus Peregrinibacteria bacterium]